MANHKNAEKCIRRIKRRTLINKNRRSLTKTIVKKCETAAADSIGEAFRLAQKNLMRAAQKGIMSKKAASKKISALHRKVKTVGAA